MRPTLSQRMRLPPRRGAGLRRAAGRRLGRDGALVRLLVRLAMSVSLRPEAAFLHRTDAWAKAPRPGNSASPPSSSSIRKRRLYLATRSEREGAPVLI